MAEYQGFHCDGSTSLENPVCAYSDYQKNKYIFLKQNNPNFSRGSTILVNPRFKDNTKVFINPNFSSNAVKDTAVTRPHIYVNPKLIKSIPSVSTSDPDYESTLPVNRNPLKVIPTDMSGRVLVSTKNKIIKVPELKTNNVPQTFAAFPKSIDSSSDLFKKVNPKDNRTVLVSTKNKYIKESEHKTNVSYHKFLGLPKGIDSSHIYKKVNILPYKRVKTPEYRKIFYTRTKIVNMPAQIHKKYAQRHSMNTRFKYIKTNGIKKKVDKTVMRSKHKIVNNIIHTNKAVSESVQHLDRNSPNSRKRYIYVNKYNSSSFLANNVILKNTSQKSLININGILYRNSPSALKKTSLCVRQHKDLLDPSLYPQVKSQHRRNTTKLTIAKFKRKISGEIVKEHQERYKLVRSRIASASKLKKSNIPCPVYKRYGKCNGQKNGTCIKIHNSDQIILCSKFLQGACVKKNCLLSHKVSPEKMPTCKFFLEGLCSRDDCQYLHVKISPKADICKDFLEGFCKEGTKCDKRHQFLCPEYEKLQKCSKRKCEYPHINPKSTLQKAESKKITKRVTKKKENEILKENVVETFEKPNVRYYIEVENKKETEETLISKRPKLGSLPSFIPFSKDLPDS